MTEHNVDPSERAAVGKGDDMREHMLKTYTTLRWALVFFGLALPIVLWSGGRFNGMKLQDSMSQYYHADKDFNPSNEDRNLLKEARDMKADNTTSAEQKDKKASAAAFEEALFSRPGAGPLRDWFVGSLFIVGALLIAYKGFLPDEDTVLNFAGCFSIGVALFYMPWGKHRSWIDEALAPLFDKLRWMQVPSIHYVCAVLLFVCLSYVCFFCGSATLEVKGQAEVEGKGRTLTLTEVRLFRTIYVVCGVAMVTAPVGGLFISHIPASGLENKSVFLTEAIGVGGFTFYWLFKSLEIHITRADRLAAKGKLDIVRSRSALRGHKVRNLTDR